MRITGSYLKGVRGCALRKRVWYKTLDKLERGIVDLTIDLVESVKSVTLVREIAKILAKLGDAMKSGFTRHFEAVGREKMRYVVETARGFGNITCSSWCTDAFAMFLALNDYNDHAGRRQAYA